MAKKKAKQTRKKKANKLDGTIDQIIEMIIDGDSYRVIAKKLKVGVGQLHAFTMNSEHSARVREALEISASSYDEKAEEALNKLKKGCDAAEIAKARELAQHYRWKAAKRNPRRYGEKQTIDVAVKKVGKDYQEEKYE